MHSSASLEIRGLRCRERSPASLPWGRSLSPVPPSCLGLWSWTVTIATWIQPGCPAHRALSSGHCRWGNGVPESPGVPGGGGLQTFPSGLSWAQECLRVRVQAVPLLVSQPRPAQFPRASRKGAGVASKSRSVGLSESQPALPWGRLGKGPHTPNLFLLPHPRISPGAQTRPGASPPTPPWQPGTTEDCVLQCQPA